MCLGRGLGSTGKEFCVFRCLCFLWSWGILNPPLPSFFLYQLLSAEGFSSLSSPPEVSAAATVSGLACVPRFLPSVLSWNFYLRGGEFELNVGISVPIFLLLDGFSGAPSILHRESPLGALERQICLTWVFLVLLYRELEVCLLVGEKVWL